MPVPGFDVPNNYYEPDDEEPMIRSANLCDVRDTPTANAENDYGEFICDDCFHDGGCTRFISLEQQQIEARRLK